MRRSTAAKQRLGTALNTLWLEHDKPPAKTIIREVCKLDSKVRINPSSLSEWLNGKAVPNDHRKFNLLVRAIAGSDPGPELQRLFTEASQESAARRQGAPAATEKVPEPGTVTLAEQRSLPRWSAIHYVSVPRVAQRLALAGCREVLPDWPSANAEPSRRWQTELAIIEALARVSLPMKRLTRDFDLRTLQRGDLLVFDRELFTHNGPTSARPVPLTGNLDRDPLIHFRRGCVRVIMTVDPACVTTGTAVAEFRGRRTQMLGLCQIKRQLKPGEAPRIGTDTTIMRLLATPLVLGVPDSAHIDPEITSPVFFELPSTAEMKAMAESSDGSPSDL